MCLGEFFLSMIGARLFEFFFGSIWLLSNFVIKPLFFICKNYKCGIKCFFLFCSGYAYLSSFSWTHFATVNSSLWVRWHLAYNCSLLTRWACESSVALWMAPPNSTTWAAWEADACYCWRLACTNRRAFESCSARVGARAKRCLQIYSRHCRRWRSASLRQLSSYYSL